MNLPPPSGPPAGSEYRSAAPEPKSGSALKRAGSRYRSWPLWAKIAAPGAAMFVGLGAIGAATEPAESADAEVAASVTVEPAELTESTPSPTAEPTTVPPTTAAPTTAVPTTPPTTAPATLPPTTAAPTTAAPTTAVPTTAAPTLPPTTAPPPPPPPPPPAPVQATDPNYGTCKEAKANGAGPYYQGQDPEYGWYRDADSDGIVCE